MYFRAGIYEYLTQVLISDTLGILRKNRQNNLPQCPAGTVNTAGDIWKRNILWIFKQILGDVPAGGCALPIPGGPGPGTIMELGIKY